MWQRDLTAVSTAALRTGFGSKKERGDIVGFVDISDPTSPHLISTTRFISQQVTSKLPLAVFCSSLLFVSDCITVRRGAMQPTGMLIVGDALFVAGEHDMMVFNLGAVDPASPVSNIPMVGTCGTACAQVGDSSGQNFHSVAYKLLQVGTSRST